LLFYVFEETSEDFFSVPCRHTSGSA